MSYILSGWYLDEDNDVAINIKTATAMVIYDRGSSVRERWQLLVYHGDSETPAGSFEKEQEARDLLWSLLKGGDV